ncbi:unnamed protein product, partial [Polarella glacialis]
VWKQRSPRSAALRPPQALSLSLSASGGGGGGGEEPGGGASAALRRLELRLEAERRHVDRQIDRLERRVEEVALSAAASASAPGGCWAELQGYVDGLAETVQGLVRREVRLDACAPSTPSTCNCRPAPAVLAVLDGGPSRSPGLTGSESADPGERDAEALSSRVAALERRLVQLEDLRSLQLQISSETSERTAELGSKLLQVGTRLLQAERSLDGLALLRDLPEEVASLAASVRQVCEVPFQAAPGDLLRPLCEWEDSGISAELQQHMLRGLLGSEHVCFLLEVVCRTFSAQEWVIVRLPVPHRKGRGAAGVPHRKVLGRLSAALALDFRMAFSYREGSGKGLFRGAATCDPSSAGPFTGPHDGYPACCSSGGTWLLSTDVLDASGDGDAQWARALPRYAPVLTEFGSAAHQVAALWRSALLVPLPETEAESHPQGESAQGGHISRGGRRRIAKREGASSLEWLADNFPDEREGTPASSTSLRRTLPDERRTRYLGEGFVGGGYWGGLALARASLPEERELLGSHLFGAAAGDGARSVEDRITLASARSTADTEACGDELKLSFSNDIVASSEHALGEPWHLPPEKAQPKPLDLLPTETPSAA